MRRDYKLYKCRFIHWGPTYCGVCKNQIPPEDQSLSYFLETPEGQQFLICPRCYRYLGGRKEILRKIDEARDELTIDIEYLRLLLDERTK